MLLLLAAAAAVAPLALGAPLPRDTTTSPAPIEDNSFLVEEAYNQEFGVVQHVSTFARALDGRGWLYTFTQEWPAPGQRHQLSYTAAVLRPEGPGQSARVGDLALNYRLQARDRDGVLVAPRLSLVLPTGSARRESGAGGLGVQANLPVTLELSSHWVTHSNLGGTVVPRGRTSDGRRSDLRNLLLGQSLIFLPSPTFNLMLEALYSHTATRVAGLPVGHAQLFTVEPGLPLRDRYAVRVADRARAGRADHDSAPLVGARGDRRVRLPEPRARVPEAVSRRLPVERSDSRPWLSSIDSA